MTFRVLFVDDEPKILQGLRRMLRGMRSEWEMVFVENGELAVQAMRQAAFDVVVSDMRMPGMSGAELLTRIRKENPETVRIILSGYSDEEKILKTVGPTHQYLVKPISAEDLIAVIRRSLALRTFLGDTRLRRLVAGIETLPTPSSLFTRIVAELERPTASVTSVVKIIESDSAMVAATLKLINSPFFGIADKVNDVAKAVRLLGFERIKTLVLQVGLFRHFSGNWSIQKDIENTNTLSHEIGVLASAIARAEGLEDRLVEEIHCAGLLSQLGVLLLLDDQPHNYRASVEIWEEGHESLGDSQAQVFGAAQAELAAYLLGLWGFHTEIVEAVAFCQRPNRCPVKPSPLVPILHFANCAVRPDGVSPPHAAKHPAGFNEDFIEMAGMTSHLPKWNLILDSLKRTFENERVGTDR